MNILNPSHSSNPTVACRMIVAPLIYLLFFSGILPQGASAQVQDASIANGAITGPIIANGTIDPSKFQTSQPYVCATNAPYSARGNGSTDDTLAIQSAINAVSSAGGGIVYLPVGVYRINTYLEVKPNVTLSGVWRTPGQSKSYCTTLEAYSTGATPLITMDASSTLNGLSIYYPNQVTSNPPTAYPFSIRGNGANVVVQNVNLVNSYEGIDLFTNSCPRHLIRRVYGQPLRMGIEVDQCNDAGKISNIYFSPSWNSSSAITSYMLANGGGFYIKEATAETMDNIYVSGYYTGLQFNSASTSAQVSNITIDQANIGVFFSVTSTSGVHLSNLNVICSSSASVGCGIYCYSTGAVGYATVANASFYGPLNYAVYWIGGGRITVTDSSFIQWNSAHSAVYISNGALLLDGCEFADSIGTAANVTSGCGRAVVSGNDLCGNTLTLSNASNISNGNLH